MRVGEVVGSYRITGKLGSGGMGAVYLAKHTLIGREAAIKVLLPELCGDEAIVARFFNEARTTTAIKHPGIVEIYDFGYAKDGSAYLVMERLEGETLGARMKRIGRLTVQGALAISRQVAGALLAAHKLGIVHRDLKPDNIYIVADAEVQGGERAKILDFGIAKLRHKGEGFSAFETQEGTVMGAPIYMAPEQCTGAEKVDQRADLYSLGCIIFEMVCGRPPFEGTKFGEVMAMQVNLPPPRAIHIEPMVGQQVDELIAKLLEKKPDRRYNDAFALLERLHELSGMAPPARPSGPLVPPPPPTPDEVGSPFESQMAAEAAAAGKANATVVSSARRTHALGPRKSNGSMPPPVPPMASRSTIDGPPTVEDPPRDAGALPPLPRPKPPSAPPAVPRASASMPTVGLEVHTEPLHKQQFGLTTAEAEAPTVWDQQQPHDVEALIRAGREAQERERAMSSRIPVLSPPPMMQQPMAAPTPTPMREVMQSPMPVMPGMPPPEQGPGTSWSATGPAARRRSGGKLGLAVVALAIAAGGTSAYFIATSDDLADDAPAVASPAPTTPSTPSTNPTTPPTTPTPTAPAPTPTPTPTPAAAVDAGAPSNAPGTEPQVKPMPDEEMNRRPASLVTIRIDSLPRGAQVVRKSDGVRLGETPFTYETEPQKGSITFVLRHKGYREEVVTVPGNRSAERKIPLTRGQGKDRAPSIHD